MLRNRKRWLGAAGAVVAATAVIVSGAAANAAVARPLHPSVAHPAALPQITITMNGKKITVSGALRSGGVRIVSKVTREAQGNPTLVRLDPGVTVAQVLKAAAGDPNNIALIASVVFSPQANKGTSVAQANLKPGQYVAVDLATRAKTPPLTTFTIAKATAPARLPAPQATMSAIEFGFRGPASLRDGELVRFANHGFLVHMIVAIRGRNAAGAQQIARLLKAGQDRQAQRLATGSYTFYGIMTHGAYQQQVVHNRPGSWVLACFMVTQDGREHTRLGMERVIRIVK
jgi:antitoxin (DNA-binding transcriptional repressor) of toxin-antitoxin stability system